MNEALIPYEVRWARTEEWKPAIMMIWKTFLKYEGEVYTEEGIENFFQFITDDDLYRAFLNGKYLMMVALDDDRVIGAATVRDHNHLSLLFVDGEYHCQGVGSALLNRICKYLKQEEGERYISLNAAPGAVDFYRKLGFQTVRPEIECSGIRVTSMEKNL